MSAAGRLVIAGVLLALGFFAGIRWHAPDSSPPAPSPGTAAAQLWTCGMHPQVIQDHPGSCPICGMALTPVRSAAPTAQNERTVRYWWDPMMNPPYISERPGKSPMGMDLVPVHADDVAAGSSVTVDPVMVQNMGVRVAAVTTAPLRSTIRAVGYLEEAQPNQHDVNLRVSGWIQRLYADTEGMHLDAGAPLFDLYSPELHIAVEELIAARRARARAGVGAAPAALYDAAVRKLTLLGIGAEQIRRLAQREAAPAAITFTSPASGHLIEKAVVDGGAIKAGERVMRIVDHSTLWLDAQVYEQQLGGVYVGQNVTAAVAARPGERFSGAITFIHPHIDPMTRAALVRIALANPRLTLRPNMYATVEIEAELAADVVVIPREAVIDSGTRQIAFVALAAGHFEPRRLTLGAQGDGMIEVRAGLAPGEQVVTSGQFLLDSESRLQEAIQKHLAQKLLAPPLSSPPPGGGDPDLPSPPPGGGDPDLPSPPRSRGDPDLPSPPRSGGDLEGANGHRHGQ